MVSDLGSLGFIWIIDSLVSLFIEIRGFVIYRNEAGIFVISMYCRFRVLVGLGTGSLRVFRN